jgi:hypothetical protein
VNIDLDSTSEEDLYATTVDVASAHGNSGSNLQAQRRDQKERSWMKHLPT